MFFPPGLPSKTVKFIGLPFHTDVKQHVNSVFRGLGLAWSRQARSSQTDIKTGCPGSLPTQDTPGLITIYSPGPTWLHVITSRRHTKEYKFKGIRNNKWFFLETAEFKLSMQCVNRTNYNGVWTSPRPKHNLPAYKTRSLGLIPIHSRGCDTNLS